MGGSISQADVKKSILELCLTEEKRNEFITYRSEHKRSSPEFMKELSSYILSSKCTDDIERLIEGDYFFGPPFHRKIPKNYTGAKRDIYYWKGSVKHLFSLITFALREYDDVFSENLYSFRCAKCGRDFLLRIKNYKDLDNFYILKADISNYVASIVPELILPRIRDIWKDDPTLVKLLEFVLLRRQCIDREGNVISCEPGGLGGIPLGNLFMNLYLMELDEYLDSRAPLYCRYSDDIIIFARTKEEAESYLEFMSRLLKEKMLSTNKEKTRLLLPGEAVEILGCRIENGNIDVGRHSLKKLKRKIRINVQRILEKKKRDGLSDEAAAREMIRNYEYIFFKTSGFNGLSWTRWLFPVISTDESLKELDHYAQDAIRYVYCGSLSNKRYRLRYEDLKKMGYRSLVHSFYHFGE